MLVRFFRFFEFSFACFLVVSGRFSGLEGVKKAPGDLSGRVLTNFHPNLTAGDPNKSKKLTELTSMNLTSIEV